MIEYFGSDRILALIEIFGSTPFFASEEARISSYSEELIVRKGDVRQTLNNTGQYGNEYAVNHAFERANKMLQEMGETTQLEPYF